jgi:hypothetical protein
MTASQVTSSQDGLDELGPIDYIVVEWPGRQPTGEAVPHLIDLVDRGIIRILDIALMAKDADGTVGALDFGDLPPDSDYAQFAGASTGILDQEELEEAASVLEPGSAAAVLIYENTWAAPFASAVRRGGGQLVASGRIPVQGIIAALDALEGKEG